MVQSGDQNLGLLIGLKESTFHVLITTDINHKLEICKFQITNLINYDNFWVHPL